MRNTGRLATLLLLGIVCAVSAPYLAAAVGTVHERPVAPLDDAYITYQYARQIAQGQPYRYNDGDPPTTGMTSPLFGSLLAGVLALGITSELLPALAVGIGAAWLALCAWLTCRLTFRLAGEQAQNLWPWAAATTVALTGAVQWGCFNGMETGFFAVLTLAAVDTFLSGRIGWCALWLSLAGLTRPEGQLLAGLMWTISLVVQIVSARTGMRFCLGATRLPKSETASTSPQSEDPRCSTLFQTTVQDFGSLCHRTRPRSEKRPRTVWWRRQIPLAAAVLVGFVPLAINWQLTGTTSSAGLLAKSWFYNVPAIPGDIARSIRLSSYHLLFERFMGVGRLGQWFVPPGLLVLVLLGAVSLWLRRSWDVSALLSLWFLGGILAASTLITATWHLGRYQVPLIPIGIILAVCGLAALDRRAARHWQRISLGIVTLLMLASSLYSTFHFADLYRRAVRTVVRQQLVVADWIRENLPSGTRVGVHDTGSLRYVGERPTYDLIGLTTADATTAWRHGAGSVFELMEHSPVRPDYFAIYPDVFSIPYLAATDLFDEQLFEVNVPDYAIASAGPVQGVWRADWHLADSAVQYHQPDLLELVAGLTLVDALDVADLGDEAAHGVVWWHDTQRSGFPTEVLQLTYRVRPDLEVLDGGRLLTGGISFDVVTRPQEPLWLVARLHAREAGSVRVEVNGRHVGDWAYPPVPGQWLETSFEIPPDAINSTRTHIALHVDADSPHSTHYAPYYFWFLQGQRDAAPVQITHRVRATFEGGLSLLGYSLPGATWHPGDAVPITLYWRAAAPTQSDAKVFLHLYNAEGKLGPQSDGWALQGTRPPYTWRPDETVTDSRLLVLPPDLAPGAYSVEVGLYGPEDGVRLPASLDGVRQSEARVPLTVIQAEE